MSDLNLAIKLTTQGGQIVVKDLQQVEAATGKVNHSLGNTGKSGAVAKQGLDQATTGSNALTSSLKSTIAQAAGIIGLGVAINSLTRAVIDVGNVTTGWDAAMQSITGSQELATNQLQHSRELAKKLGLDIRSTTDSYVQFTAATQGTALEGFKTNKVFDAISMSMRVLNRSADDTSGALKALEQMVSKGNVQAEELRGQLGERLPGAFNLAAKAMGKTTQELNKMLENGEVLAADLLPKLADVLVKKYGTGLAIALESPAQSFRNFKNETFEFNEALSDILFTEFASGAQAAADVLGVLSDNLPELLSILEMIGVVIGGHLVKALIASGNGFIANTIATNTKLQANIKLQASELLLAKSAQHKAIQEQLAAKRALALANTTYARSRAITNLAVANGKAIASERALTSATLASNSAMKKANITSRLLGGSMALLGGPVGVAMLAAYALYEISGAMAKVETDADLLKEALGGTKESIDALTKSAVTAQVELIKKKQSFWQEYIDAAKATIEENKKLANQFSNGGLYNSAETKVDLKTGDLSNAEREVKALSDALVILQNKLKGLDSNSTDNLSTSTKVLATEAQNLIDRLDPLASKARQYGVDMKDLHQAHLSGALSAADFQKYMELLTAEFQKSINSKTAELTTNQKLIASLEQQLKLSKLTGLAKLEEINLSKLSEEIKTGEIAKVKELTAALYDQQQITAQKQDDSEYYQSVIDGANDISDSWNTAGNVIVNTFGTIGEQLEKLAEQQESYANKQKKLAADKIKYADDPKKLGEISKAENALAKQKERNAMSEISAYRAITDSAANMFSENSKGRQAMQAASDVFTAVELANSAIRLGSYAVEAVAAAFAAPWPIGFASGAAMIAIMAGLGVAVSGGSGSAPTSSAERQETQSTGTLLGSDDKSASLVNSFERIEDLELDQYAELQQMNASLRSLNQNITRLAVNLLGSYGSFDEQSYGGELGSKSSTSMFQELLLGGVVGQVAKALDPTGIISSIFSSFSKTKKTLIDSGISIVGQTLGEIIESGMVNAQAYYDVETKKTSFWGLKKKYSTDTEYESLGDSFNRSFGLVFSDIADSINESVSILGLDIAKETQAFQNNLRDIVGRGFTFDSVEFEEYLDNLTAGIADGATRSLDNFKINLPKISFKDMTGEEIEQELQAMVSNQADLMAQYLVPQIAEFQQVGEGLYETLIRVAQEQAIFNGAMEAMGHSISDVAGMTKQVETEIAQSIIGLMGGLDNFREYTSTYFNEFLSDDEQFEYLKNNLNELFSGLEQTLPATRDEFKALIGGIDITTESGQALYAALSALFGPLDQYYDELERNKEQVKDTAKAEEDLAKARADFVADIATQLSQLDMSPFQIKLANLQSQFDDYLSEAESLGVGAEMLDKLYAKKRQAIVDDALQAINDTHQRELDKLTSTHDSVVNDLVNNNQRLTDSIASVSSSIGDSILNLKRQMSDWNEVNYQTGVIGGLRGKLGTGSIDEQLSTLSQLSTSLQNKYQAELDYNSRMQDVANERYQNDLSNYNSLVDAAKRLKQAADDLRFSDLSTYTSTEQFSFSESAFNNALKTKDFDQIQNSGQQYLEQAKNFFGGTASSEYQAVFSEVTKAFSGANAGSAPSIPFEITRYQNANLTLQKDLLRELESLQVQTDELNAINEANFTEEMANANSIYSQSLSELNETLAEQTLAITNAINNIEISETQSHVNSVYLQQLLLELKNGNKHQPTVPPTHTWETPPIVVVKPDIESATNAKTNEFNNKQTQEQLQRIAAATEQQTEKQAQQSRELNTRFEALEMRLAEVSAKAVA